MSDVRRAGWLTVAVLVVAGCGGSDDAGVGGRTQALAGGFSDLSFELKIHSPGNPQNAIRYRFDNLRVRSPGVAPPGAGQSVDLVALRTYAPAASTPGTAAFPVGVVQVPERFVLKLG